MTEKRRWTPEEDQLIVEHYRDGLEVVYEKLKGQRTHAAIVRRAKQLDTRSGRCMANGARAHCSEQFLAFMDGAVLKGHNANDTIRQLRINSGLLQRELAERAGYTPAVVRHLEYEGAQRFSTIVDLLEALGYEIVIKRKEVT